MDIFFTEKFVLGSGVRNIAQHHYAVLSEGGAVVFVNRFQRTNTGCGVGCCIVFVFGIIVTTEHGIKRQTEYVAGLILECRRCAPLFLFI